MRRRSPAASLLVALATWAVVVGAQELRLPNTPDSLKFAAIGDNGTGERAQYEVAAQMARSHEVFPFEMVIMLGDNMYGRQRPRDFVQKFERPYAALLGRNVKFYAALGNHDEPSNRFYEPWNMGGERYYTFQKKNVRFFVLDTDYIDPKQREWLERELAVSRDPWKIAYFHHPLYSSAGRHGSDYDLRVVLEPLFVKHGVSVVFSGHDHVYERIRPQRGISYFVSGSAGKLRRGDLRSTGLTAAGYDRDHAFMLVEIEGDVMWFQAVTRTGTIVDAGSLRRRAES
jgi:predicted phosphodiesterase